MIAKGQEVPHCFPVTSWKASAPEDPDLLLLPMCPQPVI